MKCGFITGIQTPNRIRCNRNTSTLLHPGSATLNVGWKSHGHNFLGLQRLVDYLPQKSNNGTLLRWSADKSASGSEGEAEGKSDPRSAVAIRQCSSEHVSSCTGRSQGHRILAAVSPTLLSRPDTQRLLPWLDMSAAFDCVDHSILMQRLQSTVGLSGVVLDWIESFLSDRIQRISYNGQLSAMLEVLFGVPQGSVLGLLLYILYTADLAHVVARHGLSLHQYADDCQLTAPKLQSISSQHA